MNSVPYTDEKLHKKRFRQALQFFEKEYTTTIASLL
jgi:hypothetical protein